MTQNNQKIPEKIKKAIIENPHWILNDLEVLDQLIVSEKNRNNGNIVDLRDIFLKKTKSQLEYLSRIHTHTISAAYENFLGANNLHRCIIKILEQKNLDKLINILCTDIKKILKCSVLILLFSGKTKVLIDNPYFINIKNEKIKEIMGSSKLTEKSLTKLSNNTEKLYINNLINKSSPKICSEAILSLCTYSKNDYNSILILGSLNKEFFNEKNRTDYLNILAKVISIQLNNHLMAYTND
ncbi:MAG: DUF484 family protein [Paracoccaceae bacterium]